MADHVVYGIHAVTAFLRSPNTGLHRLLVRQGDRSARLRAVVNLAGEVGCTVEHVPEQELTLHAQGGVHQGVVLLMDEPRPLTEADLDTVLSSAGEPQLLLALDGVTDPRNLGACLRSAATMGVHAVIVGKDRNARLTAAAVKAASGGAAMVPLIQVVNLARALERLKRAGLWVVGTVVDADTPLAETDLTVNIVLVMGAEGKGIRANTRKHCDILATIPMVSASPGFNVSVAAGICLYEAHRQRQQSQAHG